MTDKTVHWAGIRETTFVWGIRILYGFFRLGGRPLFWLSLWPVVAVYWLMLPRVRAASLDYLKRAFAAGLLKRRPTVFTTLTHFGFCVIEDSNTGPDSSVRMMNFPAVP